MRLLISLEVDCHMLAREPSVKEARICRERLERCEVNQVARARRTQSGWANAYTVQVNGVSVKRQLRVPVLTGFLNFGGLGTTTFSIFLLRDDEEGVNVVSEQELVPVTAATRFGLVGAF